MKLQQVLKFVKLRMFSVAFIVFHHPENKEEMMLQEQTIKKITDVILPLVKLELFTAEEVDELQRVNEKTAPAISFETETPTEIPRLYTLQETAKILKVTVKSVYDFIKEGKLELIKLGGRTSRISGDDIHRLIQRSRIPYEKMEKLHDQS